MPRLRYGVAPLGRMAGARVLLGRLLPPRQRHRPALEETERGMTSRPFTTEQLFSLGDHLWRIEPELRHPKMTRVVIGDRVEYIHVPDWTHDPMESEPCSTNSTPTKRQLPVTTSTPTTASAPCRCSSGTSSRPVPSPAPRSSSGRPGNLSGTLRDLTAPPRGYPAPGPALNIYPRRRRSIIARLIRIITKGH